MKLVLVFPIQKFLNSLFIKKKKQNVNLKLKMQNKNKIYLSELMCDSYVENFQPRNGEEISIEYWSRILSRGMSYNIRTSPPPVWKSWRSKHWTPSENISNSSKYRNVCWASGRKASETVNTYISNDYYRTRVMPGNRKLNITITRHVKENASRV